MASWQGEGEITQWDRKLESGEEPVLFLITSCLESQPGSHKHYINSSAAASPVTSLPRTKPSSRFHPPLMSPG